MKTHKTSKALTDEGIIPLVQTIIKESLMRRPCTVRIMPPGPKSKTFSIVTWTGDATPARTSRVPRHIQRSVVSRLRVMAGLPTQRNHLGRSGTIKFNHGEGVMTEIPIVCIPTGGGHEEVILLIP